MRTGLLYILSTILLTSYGQVIIKWRMNQLPPFPEALLQKLWALFLFVFDPYVFSGFLAAFLGSLTWMAALNSIPLSRAYPFMGITFFVVAVLSVFFLGEHMSWQRWLGSALVIAGVIFLARG